MPQEIPPSDAGASDTSGYSEMDYGGGGGGGGTDTGRFDSF
jgi:hypothetical protein